MNDLEIQREIFSFDEKIALGELEAAKAEERVRELKFQKARFMVEMMCARIKAASSI